MAGKTAQSIDFRNLTREELEKKRNKLRDMDREKVTGIFNFHECQGGTLTFVYRAYKGDPLERYSLTDGNTYTLPVGVVRHLNNDCWYPVHAYTQDADGKPSKKIGHKMRRCSFSTNEYFDPSITGTSAIEEVYIMEKGK